MAELIVEQCSHAGFKYEEIIALLERCNRVKVSLRTLHQLLLQESQSKQSSVPALLSFI